MSDSTVETPAPTTPAPGTDGKDYTVDPASLTPGQVIFEFGYLPVVYWGTDDSGKLEVGRFAGFDYGDYRDFSSHRGPLPVAALPDSAVTPNDRIAALESQVATLVALLTKQASGESVTLPGPDASAEPPAPAAVAGPGSSPFSVSPDPAPEGA